MICRYGGFAQGTSDSAQPSASTAVEAEATAATASTAPPEA